jgi:hypothetical protein
MAHAFLNTALYLDWDRKGLPYPILPFAINCYGSSLIKLRGSVLNNLADVPQGEDLDPPSPAPFRCFDIGGAIARAMAASPWRVALIASSSWSHSFLTSRYWYFHPDVETDKRCYEAMKAGDYGYWRERPAEEVEASGHHELLNWFCLVGAMAEPAASLRSRTSSSPGCAILTRCSPYSGPESKELIADRPRYIAVCLHSQLRAA